MIVSGMSASLYVYISKYVCIHVCVQGRRQCKADKIAMHAVVFFVCLHDRDASHDVVAQSNAMSLSKSGSRPSSCTYSFLQIHKQQKKKV